MELQKTPNICPNCDSNMVVRILYGYPLEQALKDEDEGKVILGATPSSRGSRPSGSAKLADINRDCTERRTRANDLRFRWLCQAPSAPEPFRRVLRPTCRGWGPTFPPSTTCANCDRTRPEHQNRASNLPTRSLNSGMNGKERERKFKSILQKQLDELAASERKIVTYVWNHRKDYVKWPKRSLLLWRETTRTSYHKYPHSISVRLRSKGIALDQRSNGPAVMAYLYAGGERPLRSDGHQGWNIHHIYDGRFPFPGSTITLHAIKDGNHFTQSAGLVAIHPLADACADEYSWFAWKLRYESFGRFGYNPDGIFRARNLR